MIYIVIIALYDEETVEAFSKQEDAREFAISSMVSDFGVDADEIEVQRMDNDKWSLYHPSVDDADGVYDIIRTKLN